MNAEKFTQIYNESRNGANQFFRHPLARRFAYSDGVQELAETGCYWLLDVLGTELPGEFKKNPNAVMAIVKAAVKDGKALITAEFTDDVVAWSRHIEYTDLPEGEWIFYVADDGEGETPYRCILPNEY